MDCVKLHLLSSMPLETLVLPVSISNIDTTENPIKFWHLRHMEDTVVYVIGNILYACGCFFLSLVLLIEFPNWRTALLNDSLSKPGGNLIISNHGTELQMLNANRQHLIVLGRVEPMLSHSLSLSCART